MAKWLPCLVLFLSFVPSESEDPVNVLDDLKPVSIAATESGSASKGNIQADLLLENQPPPPPPPPPQSLTAVTDEAGDTSILTSEISSSNAKTEDTNGMENFGVLDRLDPKEQSVAGTQDTGTGSSTENDLGLLSDFTGPSRKVTEDVEGRNGTENQFDVLGNLVYPSSSKNTEVAKDIKKKEDNRFGQASNTVNTSDTDSRLAQMLTTVSNADQPQQNDEPSDPGDIPDSVEIKLSGVDLRDKEEPKKTDNVSYTLLDRNKIRFQDKNEDEDPEDDTDTDRSYGNPPVLSNSDLLDLAKKIPDDLSESEREKLRQNISDSLGLSALGPGLALLPSGLNSQTKARVQEKSTTSTLDSVTWSYSYSTSTSTQSSKSAEETPLNKEDNAIFDMVKADSVEQPPQTEEKGDEHLNDDGDTDDRDSDKNFDNDEDEGGKQDQNYGRKVLNENGDGSYKIADDGYEDDNFLYEEDDENEDYTGGEVFISTSTTSTTSTRIPFGAGGQSKDASRDFEQSENKQSGFGKTGNIPETVSDSHMESIGGQSNNQDFDYQETENDYDWYYNPGKRPEVEDKLSTTSPPAADLTSTPARNVPVLPEDHRVADASTSEGSNTQIKAPDFKEGVSSLEDVHSKKSLQAPKGTIILYTAVIVVFIAGIVIFSLWKSPFRQNSRPTHQTPILRAGEEGKRLLDHPFV